jgi:hypothetical protein
VIVAPFLVLVIVAVTIGFLRNEWRLVRRAWRKSFLSAVVVLLCVAPVAAQSPAPVSPLPLDWFEARFDRLESQVHDLRVRLDVIDTTHMQKLVALDERLTLVIERDGWAETFFSNRYVQIILAATATYLTNWYLTRDPKGQP